MKKNRKRIDPRYFLEETAIRDDLDDTLAPLGEACEPNETSAYLSTARSAIKAIKKGNHERAIMFLNGLIKGLQQNQ
jgi:hypothetical protein